MSLATNTTVPAVPDVFRTGPVTSDAAVGVDRKQNAILGYVVAEEGPTKTPGRGEFDRQSLETLIVLGNAQPAGVKCHFQHAGPSDDGLGKFMGRTKNFRLDERDGRAIVRADLYFDKTSLEPGPDGGKPRGVYLMDLAESDPGAYQSSVVMKTDKLQRDPDEDGNRRPPIYRPTKLYASDFVNEGDAVHGDLFSVDAFDEFMEGSSRRLPTKLAAAGKQYIDQCFPDADRETLNARLSAFCERVLNDRFGSPQTDPIPDPDEESAMDKEVKEALDATNKTVTELASSNKETNEKLSKLTELITADREERKAELSSKERATEITALCEMSGQAKKGEATKWINDDSFSVDDVRKELFERQCKASPPADPDVEGEDKFSTKDEDAKYVEEFTKDEVDMKKDGITKFAYVNFRRQQDGLEPHEKKESGNS